MRTYNTNATLRELSVLCHDVDEPIIVQDNGKDDLAVMSIAEYKRLIQKAAAVPWYLRPAEPGEPAHSVEEVYTLFDQSEADIAAGRVYPADEVMRGLREAIKGGRV
ncbi:MAG: hypothetical protein FWC60_04945 [Firmicutes bacterium]|nr:hypothetical protein [Bacillota bacterium]